MESVDRYEDSKASYMCQSKQILRYNPTQSRTEQLSRIFHNKIGSNYPTRGGNNEQELFPITKGEWLTAALSSARLNLEPM